MLILYGEKLSFRGLDKNYLVGFLVSGCNSIAVFLRIYRVCIMII